ncbi:MAG: TonB-dependent receptor [Ignavibacteria bacterium]|nr:TonB-dependent receptor [Ignavibacteria bacterium]
MMPCHPRARNASFPPVPFVCAMLLLLAFALPASAQKGSISGVVKDKKSGETLIGVNLLVKGTYYGAASNVDGRYTIRDMNPGQYTLEISLLGYKKVQQTGVTVTAGKATVLNFDLEETMLSLSEEVVIIGERPLLDIEQTSSSRTVTADDIAVAVIENVRDVVAQQTGVVQADNEIHIRGGRSHENAFLVDGVSVQDPLAGTGFGLQLSAASIEEVEVMTGGFNAEFGQATSGVVNVTTKEAGDRYTLHLGYKRDDFGFNSDARSNWNTDIREASVSGPEPVTASLLPALGVRIPGRISLFGNFYSSISDAFTRLTPVVIGGRETGEYREVSATQLYSSTFGGTRFAPRQDNNWFWLGKITWALTPTMKLRYSFNQSVSINQNSQSLQTNLEYVEPSPGYQYEFQNILDGANTYTHNNLFHTLSWTHSVNTTSFYELKLSRFFTNLRADANGRDWRDYTEPKDLVRFPVEYYNTGRDTIGVIPGDGFWDTGNGFTWHDHYVLEYTLKGDFTSNLSEKSTFKTGFDATFGEMQVVDIYKPWIGDLGLNNDIYKVHPAYGAFYAQDNINFSGMILNLGARIDWWMPGKYVDDAVANPEVVTIPQEVRDAYMDDTFGLFGRRFKARISPRLGISHPVSDNQTLFFSYGHFTKRPRPQFVYAKLNPVSAKSTFQKFGNPNLNPETTVAYELGLRNQFTENDVFTLTAYYKDIFDYVSTRSAKITSSRFSGGSFVTYVNQDYARTRGIEAEYKKRIGRFFNGGTSFSYALATGKSSSADAGALVQRGDLEESIKEDALVWDRPMQASAWASFAVPRDGGVFGFGAGVLDDFNFYVRAFFQSGKRYTPQLLIGSDPATGRPLYALDRSRLNGAIGENWFWIDLNFEKHVRVAGADCAITIEVTNLLDGRNSTIINPVTGKAYEYGDPTPSGYNDPLYPDLQAPISPYPYNPARFLAPRNIRAGLAVTL